MIHAFCHFYNDIDDSIDTIKCSIGYPGLQGRSIMFAITGVTGKVGGAVARNLMAQGEKVRAVVRDAEKGRAWSAQGCEIAIASVEDVAGLTKAFEGA
jgi:NAD(P)-dependent dehydrogenase (short-subunit alcohol dehydrogenase family)